jgi:AsmA protein
LKSQGKVVLTSATPQISMTGKLGNIDAGALLKDLGANQNDKLQLKGIANIDLQVTTAGLDGNELTRNLNGTSHFSFVNGQLVGLNIGGMIDKAYAVVKGQAKPAESEDVTNFGVLTGTATITNGVISNSDLYIDSPRFDTKGKGVIDLVNQHIDYLLLTNLKNVGSSHDDNKAMNLYGLEIPIHISGDLSHPSTQLDLGALAQSIAKMQTQHAQTKVQDEIKSVINNKVKIKGKLGDQANKLIGNILGN